MGSGGTGVSICFTTLRACARSLWTLNEIAGPFVEHVGRDRGEPRPIWWIGGGAGGHEQQRAHERHLPVFHGPDAQPVLERLPLDVREGKGSLGAERWQLRPVDCNH